MKMIKVKKKNVYIISIIISVLLICLSGFAGVKVSSKYVLSDNTKIGDVLYSANDNQLTINYVEYYTGDVIKDKQTFKIRDNTKNKQQLQAFFRDNSKTSITINGQKIIKDKKINNWDLVDNDVSNPYNIILKYKENTTRTVELIDDYTNEVLKTKSTKCYIGDNFTESEVPDHYNFNKFTYTHDSNNTKYVNTLTSSGNTISGKNMKNLNIKVYFTMKRFNLDINPDNNKYGVCYSAGSRVQFYNLEIYYKNNSLIKKVNNATDFNEQSVPYGGYVKVSSITYRKGYKYNNIALTSSGGTISNISSTGFVFKQTKEENNSITINTQPIQYYIAFNGNGAGWGSTNRMTMKYDEWKNLSTNGFGKNGYNFGGWNFNNKNYSNGQSVGNLTETDGTTITMNAIWNIINYNISYNYNGGNNAGNPSSYNINSNNFTLKNPTRDGFSFIGWTGSNGSNASTSVTIYKGSTGNKSYTANWKEVPKYFVDINPVIQNNIYYDGLSGFTFDVYVNDQRVATNVIDWANYFPQGTKIRVVVHPREGYNILYWNDASWIVTGKLNLEPTWWDNIAPNIDNGGYFRITEVHRTWWNSKNDWASNGSSDYRVVAYVYDKGVGIDCYSAGSSGGMYMGSTNSKYWHRLGDGFSYYDSNNGGGVDHSPMFAKDCGNGWYKFWTVFTKVRVDQTCSFHFSVKDRAGNERTLSFDYGTYWGPTDENIGTEDSIRSERGADSTNRAKANNFWLEEEDDDSSIWDNKISNTKAKKNNISLFKSFSNNIFSPITKKNEKSSDEDNNNNNNYYDYSYDGTDSDIPDTVTIDSNSTNK